MALCVPHEYPLPADASGFLSGNILQLKTQDNRPAPENFPYRKFSKVKR